MGLVQASQLLLALLVSSKLTSSELGLFSLILVISTYLQYMTLGIPNGFHFALSDNAIPLERSVVASQLGAVIKYSSLLYVALSLIVFPLISLRFSVWIILAAWVIGFLEFVNIIFQKTFVLINDFRSILKFDIIRFVLILTGCLLIILYPSITTRVGIAIIILVVLVVAKSRIFNIRLGDLRLKQLIYRGFPISFVGLISFVGISYDKFYIENLYGLETLGRLAFYGYSLTVLRFFSNSISSVLTADIFKSLDRDYLLPILKRMLGVNLLLVVLSVLFYFLNTMFVFNYFPHLNLSRQEFLLYLGGAIFFPFDFSQYFNKTKRQAVLFSILLFFELAVLALINIGLIDFFLYHMVFVQLAFLFSSALSLNRDLQLGWIRSCVRPVLILAITWMVGCLLW